MLRRDPQAYQLSLMDTGTRFRDGPLVIAAVYDMIRGHHQVVLRPVVAQTGNGHRRSRLLPCLFIKAPVTESLKGLQLPCHDVGVFLGRDDAEFLAKRDITGDGLLEQRAVLLDMNKLFRIVFAGEGP